MTSGCKAVLSILSFGRLQFGFKGPPHCPGKTQCTDLQGAKIFFTKYITIEYLHSVKDTSVSSRVWSVFTKVLTIKFTNRSVLRQFV